MPSGKRFAYSNEISLRPSIVQVIIVGGDSGAHDLGLNRFILGEGGERILGEDGQPLRGENGPTAFFGSGDVDPFFGTSAYEMNKPIRGANGPTLLTWTLPDLAQEVMVQNQAIQIITVWYNDTNQFSSAKPIVFGSHDNLYFPPNLFLWGVTGQATDYTSGQLATLVATQQTLGDYGAYQDTPLGSGFSIRFSPLV